ncbi:MAG: TlpA family protein disulfide reductase [Chloroflexi bacterium]|nr:TlpA family protein disulfide reductase [Chloroflexota bacterium]MCI0791721.1 TlpA family protein disulfide reductase [Chloroflexota bacterium]MCI0822571.1 TlpA family protein disulfide reductase [Chloroflexota bacterium]
MGEVASYPSKGLKSWLMSLSRLHIAGLIGLTAFVLVACSTAAAPAESGDAPEDLAPEFEIELFSNVNHQAGESLKMSDLKGRPVVLNFWFPSCPPCVAEMPDLQKSFERHNGDVAFVGVQLIGLDTAADGQDFVDQLGVTYALGPDEGIIIRDYSVAGFPTTVFIDKDQRVVRKWTGILNEEKLEELIGDILN